MSDTAITQYEQRVALNTGFKRAVSNLAMQTMVKALGDEEGARKAVGFELAFQAAAQANPKLMDLSGESVGRALAMCMLADLRPGGNHPQMWLIPKGGDLKVWIAPHGYRELARRADAFLLEIPVKIGCEQDIEERVARCAEGGVFIPRPGEHVDLIDDLAGFYLVLRGPEGARVEWMPASEVFKRRAMSDSYNGRKPEFSPWTKWPMEMARKTALKWAFARGLISMEPAERAAVSMETEQEIVEIPPPQTVSEKAEALGLPEDIEPDWEELVPECEACGRNHTPGECDA